MSNLVQVEFFHIARNKNPQPNDLLKATDELIKETLQSMKTGERHVSGLKTVVRFFDTGNVLTSLALESKNLRTAQSKLRERFVRASILGQMLLSMRSRRLAKAHTSFAERLHKAALEQLRKVVTTAQDVAIENPNHAFRQAEKDELWEILERARGSYAVRLFVFEPSDLLSLKNKTIAFAM